MLYLVLLIFLLVVSVFLVKIGALMLEMTGMDPEWARFQALSAFTQTGFTTSEAEGAVNHPVRRRIISGLMLSGAASLITMVSVFVGTIKKDVLVTSITRDEIMIPVPKGPDKLLAGDQLLCFGRVDSIARVFLWGVEQ